MLQESLAKTYSRWSSTKTESGKQHIAEMLERQLRLVKTLIEFNDGKLIANPDTVAKV